MIEETNKKYLPKEEKENSRFKQRRLDKHIYEIANTNPKNIESKDDILGERVLKQGDLRWKVTNGFKLPKDAIFLLKMITITVNEQGLNNKNITIYIDDYMEKFNLQCEPKEASRKLENELNILRSAFISYKDDKDKTLRYDTPIVGEVAHGKGYKIVEIHENFRKKIVGGASLIYTPYGTIDRKQYPDADGVVDYVYTQFYLEMHNDANGRLLSVRSLLENTFSHLPTEEWIRDKHTSFTRIISPFIDTLNYLEDIKCFTWEWRGKGNTILTDKEKNDIENNFNLFKQAFIYFKLPEDYPDQTKLIETRKEKIKEAKEFKKTYNKTLAKEMAKQNAKSKQS